MLLALSSCYFLIPSFGIQINFFSTTGNDNSYIFTYQHRADVGVFLYFILLCIHVCIKKNLSNVQYHQQDKSVKIQEQLGS